jgi:hypothetical protein
MIPFPGWYELGARMQNPSAFTVLDGMVNLVQQMPKDAIRQTFGEAIALVVATDLWMLRVERKTPVANAQQAIDEYDGPLPEDHPDPDRGSDGRGRDGGRSSDMLWHERDGAPEMTGGDTHLEIGGRLVDTLAELVQLTINC